MAKKKKAKAVKRKPAKASAKRKKAPKRKKALKRKKPTKKLGGRKPFPKGTARNELVSFKVTARELDGIFRKADRLAGGSVSDFLRHAAASCNTKAEL